MWGEPPFTQAPHVWREGSTCSHVAPREHARREVYTHTCVKGGLHTHVCVKRGLHMREGRATHTHVCVEGGLHMREGRCVCV